MSDFRSSASGLAALICFASGLPAPAYSAATPEQTSPATTSDADVVEQIVVTARRRAEALEDVPATVAVLNASALESRGIHTQADLQTAVPGLVVRAVQHQNMLNFVIRGASLDAYSGSVPGVQPYVNEVPINANNAASFFDIDSVQVLKGPQGTLFGRNSVGGSVLVGTAQPTSEFGGYAQASYGNLDKVRGEAALNLPISGDTVLLRIAGTYADGGAFIRNLYDGKEYGDTEETSGRATLLLKPSDVLTNTTTVQYSDFGGTNAPLLPGYVVPCGVPGPGNACKWDPSAAVFNQLLNSAPGTYFPNYPNGYVFPGGLLALPEFLRSQGDYVVDACCDFTHEGNVRFAQNTTTFDLTPSLTLKNIFGYGKTHSANSYATSQTPYPILLPGGNRPGGSKLEDLKTRTISDELQLQGTAFGDKLSYILGAFYVSERTENNSPLTGVSLNTVTNTISVFNLRYHSISKDESYAIFAQGTYALTDKMNLTLGGRYTEDELSIHQTQYSTLQGPDLKTKESNPSWTASLDYHFTQDWMGYVITRGSWRVGGYNPFIAPRGNTVTADVGGSYFVPETTWDVEIGAKFNGYLGTVPVQLNVDAFNQRSEDLQKSASVLLNGRNTSATATVPEAEVTGLEGDFAIQPTDWLRFGGAFALQDASFTKNTATLYGLNVAFGEYPDVPKYSGSLFAEITQSLGTAGSLVYHADGYSQSRQYYGSLGALTPNAVNGGYTLLNARLDWEDPVGLEHTTISVFVKNATDKLYFVGGNASAQGNGLNYAVFGQPRTYGIVLRREF